MASSPKHVEVRLTRDTFMRSMLRSLSGSLEDIIGLDEAAGFMSLVGAQIGEEIDRDFRAALGVSQLDSEQVGEVLVDLKRRIQGDFYIIEQDKEKIVLGNRKCPFGDQVADRPSLCMMTSNVFGRIAAQNLGYAKVVLEKTIAGGDAGCRVVIYVEPTAESAEREGRTYFRTSDS